MKPKKLCKIEACSKKLQCRGWCYTHYRRWLKYGDPMKTLCSVYDNTIKCELCDKKVRSKGYCSLHYDRHRRHGDASIKVKKYEHLGALRSSNILSTYRGMIARCTNKNSISYIHYGGRGIKVCKRWKDSFSDFKEDMGERPDGTSLDRIDNDGNYSPDNCRWATPTQQANNTRHNRYLEHNGEVKTLTEWAKLINISSGGLRYRLKTKCIEEALDKRKHNKRFDEAEIADIVMFRKNGIKLKDIARVYGSNIGYISQLASLGCK